MAFLKESIGGNTAFLSHQQGDKAKFSTSQLQLRASACALTQLFAEHLYTKTSCQPGIHTSWSICMQSGQVSIRVFPH